MVRELVMPPRKHFPSVSFAHPNGSLRMGCIGHPHAVLLRIAGSPCAIRPPLIGRQPDDTVFAVTSMRRSDPSMFTLGTGTRVAQPYGGVLLVANRSFDVAIASSDFDRVVAKVDRTRLAEATGVDLARRGPLLLAAVPGTAAHVLHEALKDLAPEPEANVCSAGNAASVDRRQVAALEALRQLLVAAVLEANRGPQCLRARAEERIRQRAADPDFTPATLASELGVSLRQLYRALDGGPPLAQRIWEERLSLAARLLRADRERPVAEIAFECGFSEHAHFTRRFARAFGVCPRRYRASR